MMRGPVNVGWRSGIVTACFRQAGFPSKVTLYETWNPMLHVRNGTYLHITRPRQNARGPSPLIRRTLIVLVLLALGCPDGVAEPAHCGAPAEIGDGWPIAAPADVGLDHAVLCGVHQ